MSYQIGSVLEGEVTGIQPYGAFVSLGEGVQGLIHISEVKHGFIKNVNEILTVGDKVQVIIIDIDEYSKKISLSIRALEDEYPIQEINRKKRYFTSKYKHIGFTTLMKQLPIWEEETTLYLKNGK